MKTEKTSTNRKGLVRCCGRDVVLFLEKVEEVDHRGHDSPEGGHREGDGLEGGRREGDPPFLTLSWTDHAR